MVTRRRAGKKGAAMKRASAPVIDKQKLRDRLRVIGDEYVFYILDDVIELLSPTQLADIVRDYIDLKQIAPDVEEKPGRSTLIADVRAFEEKSRRGEYHEDFNVNSRNFMEQSPGTRSFIADCLRLLDRIVKASSKGEPAEVRACFELIFGLLKTINTGDDTIVFFADEGGAWQVGVDWDVVLPAWFACLAKTAAPDEYAACVVDVVDEFEDHDRVKHFAVAKKLGGDDRRRALGAAIKAAPRR